VKQDGTRWQCTFDDEFDARTGDARSLDPARWQTEVSTQNGYYTGAPETGVVCYTDDRDTVSVSAGALHLSVVPTGAQGSPCGAPATYRGGMVHSQGRFAQTYGRFEVRARLPQSTQPGLQETLWLYPEDPAYGAWPDSGEIDFAEFYSQYPDLDVPFVHYAYDETTTDPSTNTNVVTSHTCGVDPSAWNTYTVEWEPGRITILRNGRTCLVDDYRSLDALPPAAPFDRPFYVLLTQAVGVGSNAPTAATPFPATMDVDYVRAWK
jgi:beta-glucanase (GH16 family)